MKNRSYIKRFLLWFPHQEFAFLACLAFMIGLFNMRALMSIGMMALVGNALINLDVMKTLKSFWNDKNSVLWSGLFLIYALSFFWSENNANYLKEMRVMVPFAVLPFAFKSIRWDKKYYTLLMNIFLGLIITGVIWSLYQYSLNYEGINRGYHFSHSMPTPFKNDHIRFGMAVVIAYSFVLYFFLKKPPLKLYHQILYGILALVYFVYLHILASKTGLVALYSVSIYFLVSMVRKKGVMYALSLLFIMFFFIVGVYYSSQSFRNKIGYTLYSLNRMKNDHDESNYSDEGRLISYKLGWRVFKENPIWGVGIGDIYDEMERAFKKSNISTEKVLKPHNQFLLIAVGLGLFGLVYFLFLFIQTGIFLRKDFLLVCFGVIICIAWMVEALFETQYGVGIFLFFFLFLKSKFKNSKHTFDKQ